MVDETRPGINVNFGALTKADVSRAAEEFRLGVQALTQLDPRRLSLAQMHGKMFLQFIESILRQIDPNPEAVSSAIMVPSEPDPGKDPKIFLLNVWNLRAGQWARIESRATYSLTMESLLYHMRFQSATKPERWASLGAGPGLYEAYLGVFFQEQHGGRVRITCVDYAPEMTTFNKKVIAAAGVERNIEAKTGDMTSLRYPNGTFDQIICNNSLQWVPEWQRAISEMARVINPNGLGRLYLVIHNNPMTIKKVETGETIEIGDVNSGDVLDTLEANRFAIVSARQFVTPLGIGQLGRMTDRLMIIAEHTPRGRFESWRDSIPTGSLTLRDSS
ncbi:class I SAM-dependent methyltransferase [Candidatus Daviesbacteria bacterium]|nr:class I SAM-dependent methyltransferase [Candidatus Daviesbacteria bacterium]